MIVAMTFQRRGGEWLSSCSVVENRCSSSSETSWQQQQQQNYSPTACLVATLQTRPACRITPPPPHLPSICCLPAYLPLMQTRKVCMQSAVRLSGKAAAIGSGLAAVPRWDEEAKGGCRGSTCNLQWFNLHNRTPLQQTSLLHHSNTSCPDLPEEHWVSGYRVVGERQL